MCPQREILSSPQWPYSRKLLGMERSALGQPFITSSFRACMEYFSRIMQKASSHPHFEHHPHCKKLNLTHLMFAEDLILFGKAMVQQFIS